MKFDNFGYDIENPVPLLCVADEYFLLGHLKHIEGEIVGCFRDGSFRSPKTDHILDKWVISVMISGNEIEKVIYLDAYAYNHFHNKIDFKTMKLPVGFYLELNN